ncbi:KilA-N domain-containing protein [Tuwongella immobilis]|uniref:KilA-N domain-containing protein n=1 Tax=Tuwongella immobilis TaxID=692036 RepID=A0A6C2YP57_9BACT|nr:KilA-N domain-containing protein [Tuwongella immobilis]VIP02979.1 kila-n domain protein : Uncharacterized protein OS=Escherichia sp. KTE31 GN=WES_02238 PE=4 SV=1: KilA-N [Tuwongella immobilis]VTS03025.1 kila-n domain protein : Uncharacterized protein OS=Escherichia sp. KTE31 GN=WES_02238 PE=4 SV=1: KilA-N [Tuwongella immobilis]
MTGIDLIRREIAGHAVQQRQDGYVNATQLCRAARRQLNDYTRLGSTSEFLNCLASETGIPVMGLVQASKGGNSPQGTWVHPRVAIDLARWLSPQFAVVVNGWVFEIMTKGTASVHARNPESPGISMEGLRAVLEQLLSPVLKRLDALEQRSQTSAWFAIPPANGPLTTVKDRCEHLGWQDSSNREREAIRRLTQQLLSRHCKHGPHLLSGGNTLHFDSVQIPELDEAILSVWVKARGERKNQPTMFSAAG